MRPVCFEHKTAITPPIYYLICLVINATLTKLLLPQLFSPTPLIALLFSATQFAYRKPQNYWNSNVSVGVGAPPPPTFPLPPPPLLHLTTTKSAHVWSTVQFV